MDWQKFVFKRISASGVEDEAKMEKGPDNFIIGRFSDGHIEASQYSNLLLPSKCVAAKSVIKKKPAAPLLDAEASRV